jgi:outer membrane lipase/esterase
MREWGPAYARGVVVGCLLAASAASAGATDYVAEAIVPTPDVYGYIQQNPFVANYMGSRVTGQFQSLTVFGDSYADWGNAQKSGSAVSSTGRYSGGLSMADWLQYQYGLPTSAVANYAVGGAKSDATNIAQFFAPGSQPVLPGTMAEIQTFLSNGGHFGKADLVDITTAGGNDSVPILFNPAMTTGEIDALVQTVTGNVVTDVKMLVGAGAQTIAILSPGDLKYLPAGGSNPSGIDYYGVQILQKEQAALAPLAASGTRIFLFDLGTLEARVAANPALYGFSTVAIPCIAVATCPGSPQEQNQYFTFDGLHLSTAGFALVAKYQANQINAPSTIGAQAELAQTASAAFSNALFGRLDAMRGQDPSGGMKDAPGRSFAIYADAGASGGQRADQLFSFGYNYQLSGLTVGAEYRPSSHILLGGAFKYTDAKATLNQSFGHADLNSYQFAGYASVTYPHWFLDAIVNGGSDRYAFDRPGVMDTIHGATDGHGFSATLKAGYLFDVGRLRAGPVGGLSYRQTDVNGYTETGDWLLTQVVGSQRFETLMGSAGVQIRFGYLMPEYRIDPFVNITAEHNFLGGRNIVTTQSSTPLLPVITPVAGLGEITYGQVTGGFSTALSGNVTGTVQGIATFGRAGGNDYGISGSLQYRF